MVISNGQIQKAILNIIDGQKIGTFFTKTPNQSLPVDVQAMKARDGSRTLQRLSTEQRKTIIQKMAKNLIDYSQDILQANKRDLEEATKEGQLTFRKMRGDKRSLDFRTEIFFTRSTGFVGKETANSRRRSPTNIGKGRCSRCVLVN